MWLALFCEILFVIIAASEEHGLSRSKEEILVAFSVRPPFAYKDKNGILKGLDILIIENFAKKFDLQIKFIQFNESLNQMLSKEETIEKCTMDINSR